MTTRQPQPNTASATGSVINFDKFHSVLQDVNLLNYQGFVIRVSGHDH